ncbi:MAG: hypothetical protein HFE32_00440 [Clostridia bacterium]|jgi:hypothetical protein|nr:hypothetical protein [Clostridia bacterium]
MSQNNSNDKTAMLAEIAKINAVEGFEPSVFAVDYTDLTTGEVRKRLPVMTQIAWFRMKYPEGKIAVSAVPNGDCFVATAKIYPSYKAGENEFLAEATASRAPAADKPSVSAREWAQTAAIGVALRNAGFGLQFSVAGEDFSELAPDELGLLKPAPTADTTFVPVAVKEEEKTTAVVTEMPKRELTLEERYQEAIGLVCPLTKFAGRTLGDVANVEPGFIKWLAEKYTGDEKLKTAAKDICEYAKRQAA